MKKKLFSLLTLLLCAGTFAWADTVTLNAFSGTRNFTSDTSTNWSAVTKNITIYSPSAESPTLMFTSVGNNLQFNSTNGLQFGASDKGCALVFYISVPSDISVDVVYRDKETVFKLDYMGTSPLEAITSSNYTTAGTNKSSVTLSSSNTTGTLSATGAAAGYYKVYTTLRSYIKKLTVTASTTYTVTYKANGGTGDDVVDGAAASVAENTFTAPSGKAFSGWNTEADGSGTAYAVGAAVTSNLTLYAQWATAYSVTYDGNGADSGSVPTDANSYAEGSTVTVLGNTGSLVKSGYTFIGWNTQADGEGTSYAAAATFDIGAADVTLYAVWAANDYSWSQAKTDGTEVAVGSEVKTSTGGKMVVTTATIKYAGTGIEFSSSAEVTVTLDKKMQAGTVITGTLYYNGDKEDRTLYLQNSSKTTKATWQLNAEKDTKTSETFTYTVVAGDGLEGSNVFVIKRKNNVYLTSLTVVNCANEYAITPSYDLTTYVTPAALDFSGVDGLTAYVATSASASGVTMTSVDAVPADTPLLLSGTAGTTYYVPVAVSASAPETNKLVAGDGTTEIGGDEKYDYILMSDGEFHRVTTASALAAGKAYLHLDAAPAARLAIIFDDESGTTSISEELRVKSEESATAPVYNLNGQRVAQPSKGLYIVNGKKVVIR